MAGLSSTKALNEAEVHKGLVALEETFGNLAPDEVSGDEDAAEEGCERHTKALRVGTCKGVKKEVMLIDVKDATEKIARGITWGYIETHDNRKAYMPEVGQTHYDIPLAWADCLEEMIALEVVAPAREWANFLMMPSSSSLVAEMTLSAPMKISFLTITHDVMLRRLRKAAYSEAMRVATERRRDDAVSSDDETKPAFMSLKRSPETQPTGAVAGSDDFKELKKIMYVVRNREDGESYASYLKTAWQLVNSITQNEEAKRLWLAKQTGEIIEKGESLQEHYKRIVLEDPDDEETFLEQCRERLARGMTLSQIWHTIKKHVGPERYVKALRAVTENRKGEIKFAIMPVRGLEVPELDQKVMEYDLEGKFWDEKKRRSQR